MINLSISNYQVCSANSPMPAESNDQWMHKDATETDYDGDYSIELKCPHCGLVFRTGMPD